MRNGTSVLIVARPTRMRDGLRTLLKAMPQIEVVEQVDDAASVVNMITSNPPTLVLLDSNLPDHQVKTVLNLANLSLAKPMLVDFIGIDFTITGKVGEIDWGVVHFSGLFLNFGWYHQIQIYHKIGRASLILGKKIVLKTPLFR